MTTTTTQVLADAFRDAHKATVETGSARILVITSSKFTLERHLEEIARAHRNALNRGDWVLNEDGSKTWHCTETIVDTEAKGSLQYQWHKDGERVRAERVEYVMAPNGERTRRVIRRTWVKGF